MKRVVVLHFALLILFNGLTSQTTFTITFFLSFCLGKKSPSLYSHFASIDTHTCVASNSKQVSSKHFKHFFCPAAFLSSILHLFGVTSLSRKQNHRFSSAPCKTFYLAHFPRPTNSFQLDSSIVQMNQCEYSRAALTHLGDNKCVGSSNLSNTKITNRFQSLKKY